MAIAKFRGIFDSQSAQIEKKKRDTIHYCVPLSDLYGAKRTRTAGPLNAIEVLYQLSYSPVQRFIILARTGLICQLG